MNVVSTENGEHYAWGDSCDGWHLVKTEALSVIQERVPGGSSETLHFHERAEQFFFVLSGAANLEIEDEAFRILPNNGIHVPAGKKHKLSNPGGEDLLFIVISTPPSHGDRVEV